MAKFNNNDSSYFQFRGDRNNDGNKTSTAFLVRLQGGQAEAWEDFMGLYVPLIQFWCRQRKSELTRQERQDILQDVLFKVSQSMEQFDHVRKNRHFRAWLRRITKNRICDYLCEKANDIGFSRLYSDPDHLNYAIPNPSTPEFDDTTEADCDPEQDESERLLLLKQILRRLKPEFREKSWEVFRLLIETENDSVRVAETMKMKVDAVRQVRSRILRRIREEAEKRGLESDLPDSVFPEDH